MKIETAPVELQKELEAMISSGVAGKHDYLNLIALYFRLLDHGYSSSHRVPREIVANASSRSLELCRIGTQRFDDSDGYFFLYSRLIPYFGWDEKIAGEVQSDMFPWVLVRVLGDPTLDNLTRLRIALQQFQNDDEEELFVTVALNEARAIVGD